MHHQFKNRNFYILTGLDISLFVVSLTLAYGVRFAFNIPHHEAIQLAKILPWIVTVKVITFLLWGVYRGMWRYTSLQDIDRLAKASLTASLIIVSFITILNRFEGYSRSIFIADSIFTLCFCGGLRAAIRVILAKYGRSGNAADRSNVRIQLLIIGAGDAASKIIREIQGDASSPYDIVGCLDDDKAKKHCTLLGVKVRGPIRHLAVYVERYKVGEILIALPSVRGERMREIIRLCESTHRPFKTIPSLTSLMDGKVTINDVRPVNYEDLLGRPPVKLDLDGIGHYLAGKVVAVTGAGGSIGSELCRQIIRFKPAALVLIECSELNLYQLEMELRKERLFARIFPALGWVQDQVLMDRIFDHYRPQVVFHAAAYKHVPMVEMNPWAAVYNNVAGSQVIMEVAEKYEVERCVFISTDKAVRPTNVMGASKRTVEVLLQARATGKTPFMAVRFGNVVGSSGSAIPLFESQIKAGGPVTVTHPEMTRYFMTIPEACQLVLQAGSLGVGGEIFILEMGTPVKIADMARDLIRLSGKEPDQDIRIVYTGLRPGEKLYEELITHGEGIVPTAHEKIMVLRRDVDASDAHRGQILSDLAELTAAANARDAGRIKTTLNRLVPEYTPSNTASVLCGTSRVTKATA